MWKHVSDIPFQYCSDRSRVEDQFQTSLNRNPLNEECLSLLEPVNVSSSGDQDGWEGEGSGDGSESDEGDDHDGGGDSDAGSKK